MLLRDLARVFDEDSSKRDSDIVCRYGGEEFIFILPFTDYAGALIKAEKVRAAVENYPFAHREEQPLGKVTVSVGVSSFPKHAVTATSLVELADKALYDAKHRGRNRVVGFEDIRVKDIQVEESEVKPKVKLEDVLANLEAAAPPAEAPRQQAPPTETKLTMKKKPLGPEVDPDQLISSLDTILEMVPPGPAETGDLLVIEETEKPAPKSGNKVEMQGVKGEAGTKG